MCDVENLFLMMISKFSVNLMECSRRCKFYIYSNFDLVYSSKHENLQHLLFYKHKNVQLKHDCTTYQDSSTVSCNLKRTTNLD